MSKPDGDDSAPRDTPGDDDTAALPEPPPEAGPSETAVLPQPAI